jgi:hypothetical protein
MNWPRGTANLGWLVFLVVTAADFHAQQATRGLAPQEGDCIAHNFHFKSGETLPDLRLHYTTLGQPVRDANGRVTNAVPILHGTGGSGRTFLVSQFAGCCLERANCSTRAATSSFFPTASVMESPASRATECTPTFHHAWVWMETYPDFILQPIDVRISRRRSVRI